MTERERRERNKAFTPEESITFNLIDEYTVRKLQEDGDITLPKKKVNVPKDERWNTKQMNSKLLQGILNGDSISKIANSLTSVIGNNIVSATRNARTMVTGAENGGRIDSYKNLASQGVVQKKVWTATPDDRTRESHIDINGEEQDIDVAFSNGLMFPGDSSGPGSEVWNCRCTMKDKIIGFKKADGSISYVNYERDRTMHDDQMETIKGGIKFIAKAGNINRDYNTDFAKYYGDNFYNAMCDLVEKSGNDDLKVVWERYQNKIEAKDPNFRGHEYCTLNSIHVNKKDANGNSWQAPYSVTFHESGHAIDHITKDLANTNGLKLTYSSAYKDGLYPATIREEVAEMVNKKDAELKALFKEHKDDYEWLHNNGFISDYSWSVYTSSGQFFGGVPKYSKAMAYNAIQKEIKSIKGGGLAIGNLSDMLEGATDGKIKCGYGHGKSYWKKLFGVDEKLATEAFAEMTSATITNPESLAVIKRYLPKSYGVYEDMLKELATKGV